MACKRGKATPNSQTKLRLFADSAGYCQKPECNEYLFHDFDDNKNVHFAEMAHIFSASDGGARSNPKMSKEDRGRYENIILLCSNCHTLIDKAEEDFPDSLIRKWKQTHTKRIQDMHQLPTCDSRQDAKKFISKFFSENKTIFDTYGPETDEKYNPESDLPNIWKRKIFQKIIPNNRKILLFMDLNEHLISEAEHTLVNRYRQHVDDFESKHLGESDASGIQFPSGIGNIFGDENE